MSDLKKSKKLKVQLGAPNAETIVINPEDGRTIDMWKQNGEFNLYPETEDFIEANENYREVELVQENDFDKTAIQLDKSLHKDLGQPDSLKIIRKLQNIHLKSP